MSAQDLTGATMHRRVAIVRDRPLGVLALTAALVASAMLVGAAYSGSSATIASGIQVDGVEIGGLAPQAAVALLEHKSARLAAVPVIFEAGKVRVSIRPDELGVSTDWAAAVETAEADGRGVAVIQGFRRLELALLGENLAAPVHAYDAAVAYELNLLSARFDRPVQQAHLVRHGSSFGLVAGSPGLTLERPQATATIVSALAGLTRTAPVELPLRLEQPQVSTVQLKGLRARADLAASAPVTLLAGSRRIVVAPRQLAMMLTVEPGPAAGVIVGGGFADRYFGRLQAAVGEPARSARFAVSGGRVRIVPAVLGRALDVPGSAAAVLAAAERIHDRVASLAVDQLAPPRTTAAAEAMGITGLVGSFGTVYGGVPNRIHNVELVAHLINGKLIAPGATFSFNRATGARTAAKGFLTAPVIINGELANGLGGGVCQVSTTVFNAAFMAGLPITARTNHALYISHYPLGRDATVDYPDIDLRFVNDSRHWLLLRTFVGPSSLTVSLYGTPQHRRVVVETAPLVATGPMPIAPRLDRALAPGERVIIDPGMPPQSTSVRRLVYTPGGALLSDAIWYSTYRAVPELVLVGPRRRPVPATPLKPSGFAARVLQ